MPIKATILGIFLVFCFLSCNHVVEHSEAETGDILDNADMVAVQTSIQNVFHQITDSGTLDGSILNFSDTLKLIFSETKSIKKWMQQLLKDEDALMLKIQEMATNAAFHGLQTEFYHDKKLMAFYRRIHSKSWDTVGKIPYDSLAMALIYSADAAMGLYHDFNTGRVHSDYTGSIDKLPQRTIPSVRAFLGSDSVKIKLIHSIPEFREYTVLQKEYHRLYTSTDTMEMPELYYTKSIKVGDSIGPYKMNLLCRKLRLQGYLLIPDSTIAKRRVLNGDVAEALAEFQMANGIDYKATLDKQTVALLNVGRNLLLLKLAANLERWRILGPANESSKIWVNIAENRLYAYKQDTLKLRMIICSGKSRDKAYYDKLAASEEDSDIVPPDNLETPLMKAKLTHFVANPTWHVPRSIMTKEMLPQVSKNPAWFADHNYKLLDRDGMEINPFSVNWKKVTRENWRFRVEQMPGEGNALGVVVIHFPNRYSIFMHDTPSKFAFSYSNRHVSHGCIRMEKPMEMVDFITSFHEKNNYDDVLIAMGLPPERDEKKVKKYEEDMKDTAKAVKYKLKPNYYFRADSQLAVYIVYFTCGISENGKMQYFNDGYNRDQKLMQEMMKPRKSKSQPRQEPMMKKLPDQTFSP